MKSLLLCLCVILMNGMPAAADNWRPVDPSELAQKTAIRLAGDVASGALRIYNVAIGEHEGTTSFWVNQEHDDWGTIRQNMAERNGRFGTASQEVTVPCVPFGRVLDECGTPYYLKIDIEGADGLCLEALRGREAPKYLSVEGPLDSEEEAFAQIELLCQLGYRDFKVVNQGLLHVVRCPKPAREGRYVGARFDGGHTSGPFGEEAPGKWASADRTMAKLRRLIRDQRNHGMNGKHFRTRWGYVYRKWRRLMREPVAWWDIHARWG